MAVVASLLLAGEVVEIISWVVEEISKTVMVSFFVVEERVDVVASGLVLAEVEL